MTTDVAPAESSAKNMRCGAEIKCQARYSQPWRGHFHPRRRRGMVAVRHKHWHWHWHWHWHEYLKSSHPHLATACMQHARLRKRIPLSADLISIPCHTISRTASAMRRRMYLLVIISGRRLLFVHPSVVQRYLCYQEPGTTNIYRPGLQRAREWFINASL
ncbi:hypothetical protein K504DRAFT_447399 [Pleomassaria siparia CBS 279.74]|uniref:Uncharacterized protein n=1 Tax=Pleomassaria siparia CBS 279.74 TaxID=1314801 RepID=A0A6G1K4L9_9PLEO|nr:hypothetical protein K504DRAFT_447399 [Pleomassaria siparia CBS 279.74]